MGNDDGMNMNNCMNQNSNSSNMRTAMLGMGGMMNMGNGMMNNMMMNGMGNNRFSNFNLMNNGSNMYQNNMMNRNNFQHFINSQSPSGLNTTDSSHMNSVRDLTSSSNNVSPMGTMNSLSGNKNMITPPSAMKNSSQQNISPKARREMMSMKNNGMNMNGMNNNMESHEQVNSKAYFHNQFENHNKGNNCSRSPSPCGMRGNWGGNMGNMNNMNMCGFNGMMFGNNHMNNHHRFGSGMFDRNSIFAQNFRDNFRGMNMGNMNNKRHQMNGNNAFDDSMINYRNNGSKNNMFQMMKFRQNNHMDRFHNQHNWNSSFWNMFQNYFQQQQQNGMGMNGMNGNNFPMMMHWYQQVFRECMMKEYGTFSFLLEFVLD